MTVFRYDKTLDGLLTAVFDAYSRRIFPGALLAHGEVPPLFTDQVYDVATDPEMSARVWNGLETRLGRRLGNMVLYVWLSEREGADMLLMRYIRKIFDSPGQFAYNLADEDVLEVKKLAQKVSHEGHYLQMFVRFQKAGDDSFFAPVSPEFNSLPIAIPYFTDRFRDQKWLIYDVKRRYGYYYDLKETTEVTIEDDGHLLDGKLDPKLMAEDEKRFQTLWKNYFDALAIRERINPRLQSRQMPRRYWKFITEKQ
ncbi:MAG: TIGR03915 family putative DNA repair protein [Rikenellaceae bacterium]|nr:TIGR03915 family putative DNA repair protein [Rikenellaceae bacterium]